MNHLRSLNLLPLLAGAILFAASASPLLAADDIPAARVVLPWNDFQKLYEAGKAPKEKPEAAPRNYAISRAVYTGKVQEESVLLDADIKVEVLKDKGWVTVPLLPTSVALKEAKLGGADAPIYLENGWYWLVTDKKGTLNLKLSFAVNLWETGGQNGFSFGLTQSGGTEVNLSVPSEKALEFKVAGAQQVTDETRGKDYVMRALLPSTGNLSVSWQRKAIEQAQAAETARVYAEHQALVGVSEGLLHCNSAVHYSILHAGIQKLAVDLPEDVTILEVKGNGIQDWRTSPEKGGTKRTQVDVDLNFEAKGSYSLYVEYERAIPEGSTSILIPDLHVDNVERVKGWVGIDARSNLELTSGKATDASVVDVRELPTAILGQTDWPILLAYKYRKESFAIPIEIRQHQDVDMLVTIVDELQATTVMTPDGRRMTQIVYDMRNNRAQFLKLDMPKGAQPWSTFVGGRSVKPAKAEDGRLLIPLARSQTAGGELAQFAVELVYVEDGSKPDAGGRGEFDALLPRCDVPTTLVDWTVYLPAGGRMVESSLESSLRKVNTFTSLYNDNYAAPEANAQVQRQAQKQFEGEAMAAGVQPVKVTLPVNGTPVYFEKLLVLEEPLTVKFAYRGIR